MRRRRPSTRSWSNVTTRSSRRTAGASDPGRVTQRGTMDVTSTIQWATPVSMGLVLGLTALAMVGFALLRLASGRPIAPARRAGLLLLRASIPAVLAVILINPVRVDETPGAVERPKVVYLVDTSQSMALGKQSS